MTWAQIIGGKAVNVVTADPVLCFPAEWLAGQPPFIQVPDGTQNYAADNGDGTFTSPPDAPTSPLVLDSADWKGYAYTVLGSIALPLGTTDEKLAAGMRRYGAILKAARASTDDGTIAALDQYDDATNFRKDKVSIFLSFLNADGEIVTTTEFQSIIGGWPEG